MKPQQRRGAKAGAGRPRDSRQNAGATKPLSGLRVLVGRARRQAGTLSSKLRALGAQVLEIPFIEIKEPRSYRPLDTALRNLQNYGWLIFTSVNGVEAVWARMQRLGITRKQLTKLRVAAIGPATRKALEERGLKVAVVPKEYVAESVVKSLRTRVKGKRVLLARAKVARDVIPRELRKLGARVDVVEAYETIVPMTSRSRLRSALSDPRRRPHVVTFTSSSTVRNFVALCGKNVWRQATRPSTRAQDYLLFASIGPVTSTTLRELGLPVHIEAREYTIPGLIRAILALRRG
jgi:uroporphyrinogen-III synthase